MPLPRPDDMFDRDRKWSALTAFATDDRAGATLDVVSGRLRQGKTYLLCAMCQATVGFYFAADQATPAPTGWPAPETPTAKAAA